MDEDISKIAIYLKNARLKARVSQEAMAAELMVARKTVQNWESGVSSPSLEQGFGWFRVLGISPLPFLFQYVFPSMENISPDTRDEELRNNLLLLIKEMPAEGIRQLMYLFYGNHDSSPRAVMQMVTAHLQCPMENRIAHETLIMKDYELSKKLGKLTNGKHIQPDIEMLKNAIEQEEKMLL